MSNPQRLQSIRDAFEAGLVILGPADEFAELVEHLAKDYTPPQDWFDRPFFRDNLPQVGPSMFGCVK